MTKKTIHINSSDFDEIQIGYGKDLVLIAGPCAIESRDHSMRMAEMIGRVCDKLGVLWIFKACYDKDCRSSPSSFHGLGLDEGLVIISLHILNRRGPGGRLSGSLSRGIKFILLGRVDGR